MMTCQLHAAKQLLATEQLKHGLLDLSTQIPIGVLFCLLKLGRTGACLSI